MTEPGPVGAVGADAATAAMIAPPRNRAIARAICPFLISATGDFRLAAPTRDHRCSAFVPLTALSIEKQSRLCLTANHTSCATYAASVAARRERPGTAEPSERVGRWGYGRTAPLVEDTGGVLGTLITMIADRRTWPAIPAVLLVATLIAVGISGVRPQGETAAIATATPPSPTETTPEATSASTPEPTVDPSIEASAAPSTAPSIAPSVAPSIAPSAAPSAQPGYRTYTVQSGDTLSSIAVKFQTTVSAIETLNGITDPRKLHVGQKLKIPSA